MMDTTIYLLIFMVLFIDSYKLYVENIESPLKFLLLKSIQSWIVLNGIIPFSIKILLSLFRNIQSRNAMKKSIKIINPYINDQFPQIDYILSDKTGTITKNNLELITLVDVDDNIYDLEKDNKNKPLPEHIIRTFGLSICLSDGNFHTPEDKTIYQRYVYLNCKIEYNNEYLYNVLMEKHYIIKINNMRVETLNPLNFVAQLYTKNYTPEEKTKLILEMNKKTAEFADIKYNTNHIRNIHYTKRNHNQKITPNYFITQLHSKTIKNYHMVKSINTAKPFIKLRSNTISHKPVIVKNIHHLSRSNKRLRR